MEDASVATIVAGIFLGVLVAVIYGAYRWIRGVFSRGHELNALVEQGVTVTGYVESLKEVLRSRVGTNQLSLTYRFQDASGQEHRKRLKVFSREFAGCAKGDPLEVVYLREKPEVNATRKVVDEMRSALDKQKNRSRA